MSTIPFSVAANSFHNSSSEYRYDEYFSTSPSSTFRKNKINFIWVQHNKADYNYSYRISSEFRLILFRFSFAFLFSIIVHLALIVAYPLLCNFRELNSIFRSAYSQLPGGNRSVRSLNEHKISAEIHSFWFQPSRLTLFSITPIERSHNARKRKDGGPLFPFRAAALPCPLVWRHCSDAICSSRTFSNAMFRF